MGLPKLDLSRVWVTKHALEKFRIRYALEFGYLNGNALSKFKELLKEVVEIEKDKRFTKNARHFKDQNWIFVCDEGLNIVITAYPIRKNRSKVKCKGGERNFNRIRQEKKLFE